MTGICERITDRETGGPKRSDGFSYTIKIKKLKHEKRVVKEPKENKKEPYKKIRKKIIKKKIAQFHNLTFFFTFLSTFPIPTPNV